MSTVTVTQLYRCRCLCDLGEGSIRNLTRMISTALDRLISQRQEYVAGHLLTVLRHDYKLHRDLALVEVLTQTNPLLFL